MDDQTNIKFLKQEEYNAKVLIRLDQEIENRTKAFERIETLEHQVSTLKTLLDQYFTLELDHIKESHGKRKTR